jgi:hypothetical protein
LKFLAGNWPERAPNTPFLPDIPDRKSLKTNHRPPREQHGMEEVVGSIPTRSTNSFLQYHLLCCSFQCLGLLLLASLAWGGQQDDLRYRLLLQNHSVRVFGLELLSGRQAPVHDNMYDGFWIALDDTTLEVDQRGSGKREFRMWSGDAHFLPAHNVHSIVNLSHDRVRALLVELRLRGWTGRTCDHTGEVESAICGFSGATRLPLFWALALGDLTLSGVTLSTGRAVEQQRTRGDTLLVAITSLKLLHETNEGQEWEWVPSPPTPISLLAGEVAWIPRGKHHLHNSGDITVRFLTLEF